jgi:hypothetical protein
MSHNANNQAKEDGKEELKGSKIVKGSKKESQ